jgi:oligopeptide/dipeptide ABC transporter ATP-binding protein
VEAVSLSVDAGEVLALVGESGSGKSVTALAIIGLHPPVSTIIDGDVVLNGRSLLGLSPEEWSTVRGNEIAMILQDPLTALNPVFSIGNQVGEGPKLHTSLRGTALRARVIELLQSVQIPQANERVRDFPHQFSGGMRQRVVGAIAIACNPSLLIADEPTTSLDVTVEHGYLDLLKRLQEQTNVGILFITHDFGIVGRLADRVAVMYSGRVVETGLADDIITHPAHPYTEALVRSVPDLDGPPPERLLSIEGSPPSLFEPKPPCHFAPRCPYVMDICWKVVPPDIAINPGHVVKCWKYG